MRRLLLLVLLAAFALSMGPAAAQDDANPGAALVAEIEGPVDQRLLDFMADVLDTPDAQVVIFQVNSPGLASGDSDDVLAMIDADEVPVAIWVGPQGAVARGAFMEEVIESADVVADADSIPTIGQFIIGLDGQTVQTQSGSVTLETGMTVVAESGIEVQVPSVEVRFLKPGLFTRFLRLASRPEATFFFLVVGLVAIAFEFYAAGAGVTAAVAALSLFLAGYGFATLPMDWLAVALVALGMLAYTMELQRNQVGPVSIIGTGLLIWGGLTLTNTPGYPPRWWAVLLTVVGVALFYAYALTTVVRARFSTRTIGRDQLIGRMGTAETEFDPMGVVVVDGARWQARSHRAAGLAPGDPIEVLEVKGITLEVGPPSPG